MLRSMVYTPPFRSQLFRPNFGQKIKIHLANVELSNAELPKAELLNAELPNAELLNAESY